jgi:hypothetical protein
MTQFVKNHFWLVLAQVIWVASIAVYNTGVF